MIINGKIIYFDFCREYVGKTKIAKEKDYDASMKPLYQRNMCNHKAYGSVWNKCVKRRLYLDNVIHFPPYLADRISEAPLDCKGGESVFVQLLLKLYAWLRRKNKKD